VKTKSRKPILNFCDDVEKLQAKIEELEDEKDRLKSRITKLAIILWLARGHDEGCCVFYGVPLCNCRKDEATTKPGDEPCV
jgi:hypothetical protein